MNLAYEYALLAKDEGEVPVGAVVVLGDRVLAKGHNEIERRGDASAHAELIALRSAARELGDWRLNGCSLYVTLEPCPMCTGLAVLSRVERIAFGARDPRMGACGSVLDLARHPELPHSIEVAGPVDEQRCGDILQQFFRSLR